MPYVLVTQSVPSPVLNCLLGNIALLVFSVLESFSCCQMTVHIFSRTYEFDYQYQTTGTIDCPKKLVSRLLSDLFFVE